MGISPHLGRRALSRARLLPSVSCILASLTRTIHALASVDLDKEEVASLFTSPLNNTPSAPPNEVASNAKKPTPKQNVQLINRRCGTVNEPKEFIAFHPNFERNGKEPNSIFINADRVEKIESNTPFEVEYAESCKVSGALLPVSLHIAITSPQQPFLYSLFYLDAQGWSFLFVVLLLLNYYSPYISIVWSSSRWECQRVKSCKRCKRKEKTPASWIWTKRSHTMFMTSKWMLVLLSRMIQNSANISR